MCGTYIASQILHNVCLLVAEGLDLDKYFILNISTSFFMKCYIYSYVQLWHYNCNGMV